MPDVRRLFWVAAGATIGVLVVRKMTATAQKLTPTGLSSSASGALNNLAEAVRDFAADVRAGMAEREHDLWTSLQVTPSGDESGSPFDAPGGIR